MSGPGDSVSVRINVEIAHVRTWSAQGGLASAEESLLIADEYCHGLQISAESLVLVVLVDDKVQPIRERESWLDEVTLRWPAVFSRIDFICFESDLSIIADIFIAQLRTQNRARRAREIERYRNKHGRIACSHDIAIWHSFRLGRLGRHDQLIFPGSRGMHLDLGSFYCPNVVSILEEEDREDEARAREIMLEADDNGDFRVETIFYAP